MSARAFVIVNPAAGGGRTGQRWPGLQERLHGAGLTFEWAATAARGDGVTVARRAARDGWPLVVAVGGDGTVNEVINGLVDAEGRALATLGVVLTGRGRDVCRNLGVPRDPVAAALRLVPGGDTAHDLGLVEWAGGRRYFVNAAGCGFDAEVARRTQSRAGSGTLPYLLGVLAALRAHAPAPVTLMVDGSSWSGRAAAVVVANGAWYGGGMKIAPEAATADGSLDLVVLGDIGRLELLRWLPAVYRGAHVRNPKVVTRPCRRVAVDSQASLPVHVDGELATTTPVHVEVRPGALRLRR